MGLLNFIARRVRPPAGLRLGELDLGDDFEFFIDEKKHRILNLPPKVRPGVKYKLVSKRCCYCDIIRIVGQVKYGYTVAAHTRVTLATTQSE